MTICVFAICCTFEVRSSADVCVQSSLSLSFICSAFAIEIKNINSVDMFICKMLYTIYPQRSLHPAFASTPLARAIQNCIPNVIFRHIRNWNGEIASIGWKPMANADASTTVMATATSHRCMFNACIWFISISISIFIFIYLPCRVVRCVCLLQSNSIEVKTCTAITVSVPVCRVNFLFDNFY